MNDHFSELSVGDLVRVTDPATDTAVHQGAVTEITVEYFTVDVGDVRPRRFDFWWENRVKPCDRPHEYELEIL